MLYRAKKRKGVKFISSILNFWYFFIQSLTLMLSTLLGGFWLGESVISFSRRASAIRCVWIPALWALPSVSRFLINGYCSDCRPCHQSKAVFCIIGNARRIRRTVAFFMQRRIINIDDAPASLAAVALGAL